LILFPVDECFVSVVIIAVCRICHITASCSHYII